MAVGDVTNNLPVNINVKAIAEAWKDQSGKYWLGGDDDPKLCFCRNLSFSDGHGQSWRWLD